MSIISEALKLLKEEEDGSIGDIHFEEDSGNLEGYKVYSDFIVWTKSKEQSAMISVILNLRTKKATYWFGLKEDDIYDKCTRPEIIKYLETNEQEFTKLLDKLSDWSSMHELDYDNWNCDDDCDNWWQED